MPFNMRSGRSSTPFGDSNNGSFFSAPSPTPPSPASKKRFMLPWSKKRQQQPPPPPVPVVLPVAPPPCQRIVDSNSSSTVSTVLSSAFDTYGSSNTCMTSPETSPQKSPPQVGKYSYRSRPGVVEAENAGKALHEAVRTTPPRRVPTIKFDHSPPFDPSFERAARRYSEDSDDEEEGLYIQPSPSFDPSIIGATFLGAPSTTASLTRIPSIHVEGLSMDDVFRELEEKMGLKLDDKDKESEAQLAAAVRRISRRLSTMGQLDRLSSASRQRLSYLTEPTSLAYARDEDDVAPGPESPSPPPPPKAYRGPVRTSSIRQETSPRPKGKKPAPISIPLANSASLADQSQSPTSAIGFSVFSPRPDHNSSFAQGLGPPLNLARSSPEPTAGDDNLPAVFVLPPTPELGSGSFDLSHKPSAPSELPSPEKFNARPAPAKTNRRRRDSISLQKGHRRRPTCGPSDSVDLYTPPLSPATSTSTVSSLDSPCFPNPPVSLPQSSSVVSDAEETLKEMFARLCQPHTPPQSPPSVSHAVDDKGNYWREPSRPVKVMRDQDYQRREHSGWTSARPTAVAEVDNVFADDDKLGQFADAPSIPDFGMYADAGDNTNAPRVIVTSPSTDRFAISPSSTSTSSSKTAVGPSGRFSPDSIPSDCSSIAEELSDVDEAVVTVCERRSQVAFEPETYEFGLAM
jgi:hypothetical protein